MPERNKTFNFFKELGINDPFGYDNIGWLDGYKQIPYRIRYSLVGVSPIVTPKNPGLNMVTQNTGGGYSLSVWVHRDVPKLFKPIVLYHELNEANYRYGQDLEKGPAHLMALREETTFAEMNLDQKKYDEYLRWRASLKKV